MPSASRSQKLSGLSRFITKKPYVGSSLLWWPRPPVHALGRGRGGSATVHLGRCASSRATLDAPPVRTGGRGRRRLRRHAVAVAQAASAGPCGRASLSAREAACAGGAWGGPSGPRRTQELLATSKRYTATCPAVSTMSTAVGSARRSALRLSSAAPVTSGRDISEDSAATRFDKSTRSTDRPLAVRTSFPMARDSRRFRRPATAKATPEKALTGPCGAERAVRR